MALAELASRLNCSEYKNWVKAGHSLVLLGAALQRFAAEEAQAFHRQLLARHAARLCPPGRRCRGQCSPRGKQFQPACSLCKEWKREILNHHTHRTGEVNWGNCKPWLWPSNPWELAKAYMPRGKVDSSGPDKCDASALLNLFSFCDHFNNINQKKVREVIKCRNELMHSSDMKISSSWLKEFGNHVQNLLTEFQHVPEVQTTGAVIEKLLSSDWAVHVPGGDQPDGLEGEMTQSRMSEIESELIKERLHEIKLCMEEEETVSEEILQRIKDIWDFLKDNQDLQKSLQGEMQNLEELVQEFCDQKELVKMTPKMSHKQEKDEGTQNCLRLLDSNSTAMYAPLFSTILLNLPNSVPIASTIPSSHLIFGLSRLLFSSAMKITKLEFSQGLQVIFLLVWSTKGINGRV